MDLVPEEAIDVVGSLMPVSPLRAAMDAYSLVRAEYDEAGKTFTHGGHERGVKTALEAAAPLILAAELERQAALLIDKAESFGEVPPNTSSSGAVIALRDTAEEIRVRAADLRERAE